MVSEALLFAPVALPLLGAALALGAKAWPGGGRAGQGWAAALEILGAVVGLILPWAALAAVLPALLAGQSFSGFVGGWDPLIGVAWRYDGFTWLMNVLGFAGAGAAWLYSRGAGPRGPAFTGVFLLQTMALAATALTADLFNLFVCLEVLGLASYILVASADKPGGTLAAFSYLLVSATAMIFFLLGLYGFYRLTGSLSYEGIAQGLAALPDQGGLVGAVSLALIVAAVALRVAVMPLYGWLPDAHALAPHAVSAVLSGVLIKTPLFALSRVLEMSPVGPAAAELLSAAGALTALLAVGLALAQDDTKRLLAYHSVSQIGYVVCAWGASLALGGRGAGAALMTAAVLHALFHTLFKGLLFLSVGTASDSAGRRRVSELGAVAGLLRRSGEGFPWTAASFAVGALSIMALPPFNGYASKLLLGAALKGTWQEALLLAAGVGTVASFLKLGRVFFGRAGAPGAGAASEPLGALPSVPADPSPPGAYPSLPAPARSWARRSAQTLLAAACLGTGLAAPALSALTLALVAPGPGLPSGAGLPPGAGSLSGAGSLPAPGGTLSPDMTLGADTAALLWSPDSALKTALTLAAGLVLWGLIQVPALKHGLKALRSRERRFEGLFVAFALGTLALNLWLVL